MIVIFLLLVVFGSGSAFAQTADQTSGVVDEQKENESEANNEAKPQESVEPAEPEPPQVPEPLVPVVSKKVKSATYLKAIIIHGDLGLYGYRYYFNDMNFEVEHHWSKRHLGLSGFSIGLRKESFSSADFGYFLNSKVFWKAEKHGFYFKPAIGGEWGKPSSRFEQTLFHYNGAILVFYERIYRERNAWMPVGVQNTGSLNPFFELGIGQKAGLFIFEGGARIGYDKFLINTFQFKNGDLTFQGLSGEYNFVPTLYFGIGLKLF